MIIHGNPVKLCIGLPVYNGDNYLDAALESVLSQTFHDFELVISDNCSTDRTEDICRSWAAKDSRIRYFRNQENLGAARNFNRVFELSDTEYFKWIAHDDMHAPDFLETCIQVLDKDPSTVLVYSRAVTIDWEGRRGREWGCAQELGSPDAAIRFRASLCPPVDPLPLPLFGVIRSDVLRNTPLQAGYAGCDRALLAEISLYGCIHEVPDPLFLQREHKDRAGPLLSRNPGEASTFWMGRQSDKPDFSSWRYLYGNWHAVSRAPLGYSDRLCCYREVFAWMSRERKNLFNEITHASEYLPVLGSYLQGLNRSYRRMVWNKDIKNLTRDIESLVPEEATFIFVDEGNFTGVGFSRRYPVAFPEHDGQYWGPPANDNDAIHALQAMEEKGASFLVVGWPAFWWLNYYKEWNLYIRERFSCIEQNERVIVFDMSSPDVTQQDSYAGQEETVSASGDGKKICF